jgi:hypothetical protein
MVVFAALNPLAPAWYPPFAKVREEAMNLDAVQEIERAIDALTPDQREELYVWLDEHYLQSGDMQLKAAIDAGRFDDRITRALADHKAGRTEPF